MNDESKEITVQPEQIGTGVLMAPNAGKMLAVAQSIAEPLAELIEKQGLYMETGKGKNARRHVYCEGWTTLGAMLGVTPAEEWVRPVEGVAGPDGAPAWEAKVSLIDRNGIKVGGASGMCGGPSEIDWHQRPRYEWSGPQGQRTRQLVGHDPVPDFQRRSMAITRATGKAFRLAYSWIMVLAGYAATPAEEMTAGAAHSGGSQDGARQSNGNGIQKITAKRDGTCGICKHGFPEGEEIYWRPKTGGTAHIKCADAMKQQDAEENGGGESAEAPKAQAEASTDGDGGPAAAE